MTRVKLTFDRGEHGERVIIRKDGGFSTKDVETLTHLIEDLFGDGGAEESSLEEIGDEDTEGAKLNKLPQEATGVDKSFADRVKKEAAAAADRAKGNGGDKPQTTPPAGRGQVQAKVAEGVGITKDGTVDRRTLRGSPENPDPKQQKVAKAVESTSEAGA